MGLVGRVLVGRAMALINPALTRAPHLPAPQGVPAASPRPPRCRGRRGRACCPAPPAPPTACTARPAAASCCCSATLRARGRSSPGTCHLPVTCLSPACHLPCPLTARVTPRRVPAACPQVRATAGAAGGAWRLLGAAPAEHPGPAEGGSAGRGAATGEPREQPCPLPAAGICRDRGHGEDGAVGGHDGALGGRGGVWVAVGSPWVAML